MPNRRFRPCQPCARRNQRGLHLSGFDCPKQPSKAIYMQGFRMGKHACVRQTARRLYGGQRRRIPPARWQNRYLLLRSLHEIGRIRTGNRQMDTFPQTDERQGLPLDRTPNSRQALDLPPFGNGRIVRAGCFLRQIPPFKSSLHPITQNGRQRGIPSVGLLYGGRKQPRYCMVLKHRLIQTSAAFCAF